MFYPQKDGDGGCISVFLRGQATKNGDFSLKPGTTGHPRLAQLLLILLFNRMATVCYKRPSKTASYPHNFADFDFVNTELRKLFLHWLANVK